MLERYNLDSCTFFTSSGEIGFALHEMYEVSGLPMGDLLYEDTFSAQELHLMKKDAPLVYETYWEVLCHFHMCAQIIRLRAGGIKQMSWAS